MFTGLIEEVGSVVTIRMSTSEGFRVLQIAAPHTAKQVHVGDSVAVNGCCLSVSSKHGTQLTFDLLAETIARTNLKTFRRDTPVNLECALAADERLGGHFVQGHIDCTSPILAFEESRGDHRLEVRLRAEYARYVASKGSIAINGISLTVAEVLPKSFVTWIVPYTKRHTNLDHARAGDLVNLEFDILAKYVERMLGHDKPLRQMKKIRSGGCRTAEGA
jgi:riboflavin synthase